MFLFKEDLFLIKIFCFPWLVHLNCQKMVNGHKVAGDRWYKTVVPSGLSFFFVHGYIPICSQILTLKELQNYNRKLFLCHHKNRRTQNKYFKLLFFKKNLHFGALRANMEN